MEDLDLAVSLQDLFQLYFIGKTLSTIGNINKRNLGTDVEKINNDLHCHVLAYRLCDYHVPVLFATQEGLYLRILDTELASPPSKDSQELEVMNEYNQIV